MDTRSEPNHITRNRTVADRTQRAAERKRYIVIRNGRGIIADGNDMEELERAYVAVADGAEPHREGAVLYDFPPFASLMRCDHEGETGKVCIVDAEEAPDSVKAYYSMGFVD